MLRSGFVDAPGSGEPVKQERSSQFPWWRRLLRAAVEVWRLGVIWWFATLPALFTWWALNAQAALVVLVVIVVGSRWAPAWSWRPSDLGPSWLAGRGPTVRVDHRRAVAQTYGVGFRMMWPWIAAQAAITVTTGGYWRAPKIKAYDQGPGGPFNPAWRAVTIKPVPLQRRQTWPDLADQVMRTLNQAEVATTVDERHRLRMVFTRDPLPRFVELPLHRIEVENFVPLGVGVGGREIGWRPDDSPHITITGITKGGKGITLRCIERHATQHGWVIHRANPKLTGESDWLEGYASIADTPPGMWAQSQYLLELMTQRQAEVKAAGVDDWTQVPGIGPRALYIIDEGANLVSPAIRDLRKIYATFTSSNLTSQGAMARSAGIHLVYVTQQPSVDSYGYAGGQLRLNIGARMIVGSSDSIWLRELFLGDLSPDIATALAAGIKGRAVFQGLDPEHGPGVQKAQIYYASQDTVRAGLPAEPPVPPIDFNAIGPARWEAFMAEMSDAENAGRQRRPSKARDRNTTPTADPQVSENGAPT